MGWLVTLGILFLTAITPLGVRFRYNAEGILLDVIIGPARITILPAKKKETKPKKEKKKEPKKAQPAKQPSLGPKPEGPKKESGGKVTEFLPLVKVALDFLGDLRRKLRINNLELKLIMAADDPCDLAVNYGRAWAAVGNLMPQLEKLFVIKKRDIEVECDFTASEMRVIAGLDLTITIGRLIFLAVRYGFRAVKELLNIKNKRKGGAAK